MIHRGPAAGRRRHSPWISLLSSVLLLTACLHVRAPAPLTSAATADGLAASASPGNPASPAAKNRINEATLLAVGDIMVHMPQLPAYYDSALKRYNFSPWFTRVAPILQTGDWVIGNLETPLAGAELKYTGFPRFNAPAELAEALYGAGVGLVSTANNHAMDRGFAGVQRTLRNIRKTGLIPVGSAESPEDSERLTILERNGIRMGFLSYTYGTNGMPVPKDKPYAVNLIHTARIAEDIRRLREADADAVTVSLHFGTEYQRMPSGDQRRITREVIGSGADIVLGSHPHVIQPYDVVEVPASESSLGENRKGLVIYSLGNFISNQTGNWKDVGLIFGVRLVKSAGADGTFVTTWDEVRLIPTWVHIDRPNGKPRHYTILPIRQTLEERSEPHVTDAEYKHMKSILGGIDQHLQTFRKK
jgi:poly-gamma-glutamate capsule biosynthesis protein CapA/YwtB (metallophosphatase superfamily)